MRPFGTAALLLGAASLFAMPALASAENIRRVFIMNAAEDNSPLPDQFEIWELKGTLGGSSPALSLTAVAVLNNAVMGIKRSNIFVWRHDSASVVMVKPGIYRVVMNGRLSPCSGLELVVKLTTSSRDFADVSGTMRTGTQCQSVHVYSADRTSESKAIPPIYNPSWETDR